ncbi:MAG: metalloregulator ArsR/SmtB family transcription factor [Anaerolineae bacterium]|nr:metalloregulator ArsR/SmtB family transcription factor [Anaerolineae bacterium]
MPVQDIIVQPESDPVIVALEPAHHAVHSFLLVTKTGELSGLGEWVARTSEKMTAEERREHEFVTMGFFHAILPGESWTSFPAYLDHLATGDPASLRDRMLTAYAQFAPKSAGSGSGGGTAAPSVDLAQVLKDEDSYLEFLRAHFDAKHVNEELEVRAYSYVVNPPAMQELIVTHLRKMWHEHLATEWARVEPMLRDSVRAFAQTGLDRMGRREAVEWVTGHELEGEHWDGVLEEMERIILVPSAHVGPYKAKFREAGTLWLLFGARLPEGSQFHAPDLSRAEIVVRLSALADDNRLRILQSVSEGGELASQEIMAGLGLSQSAASRHLKQLSATGYLAERRCGGAKCYRLDPERVEDTLQAVSKFLLGK